MAEVSWERRRLADIKARGASGAKSGICGGREGSEMARF